MSLDRIKDILEKFDSGNCTAEELNLLKEWYMSFEWTRLDEEITVEEVQAIKYRTWYAIQNEMAAESEITTKGKLVSISRNRWWIAAASILVLFLGMYLVYQFSGQNGGSENIAAKMIKADDVAPGGNKATLTLADGTTIVLDSAANGNLASQGNIKVIKLDGQLSYSRTNGGEQGEVLFNTISTPRGGQYQLILADGSKVWLNAASSLRFPATFSGNERKVELIGEGYFEVAKNAAMPFKVELNNGTAVEVLGTQFNVMAYDDEHAIKTTLVEGKVKITNGNSMVSLLPSQQAVLVKEANSVTVVNDADVDKATAWKNGLFNFDDDDITDVMLQLSRWYDVDISYKGRITAQHYTGSIRRQVNISEVLYMLSHAGGVSFSSNGRTIIVHTK